jgi:hypothetical protein
MHLTRKKREPLEGYVIVNGTAVLSSVTAKVLGMFVAAMVARKSTDVFQQSSGNITRQTWLIVLLSTKNVTN